MTSLAWSLQIYAATDETLQQAIVGRLRNLGEVNVEPASNGPDAFVIAECPQAKAQDVCAVVIQTDPLAVLIHEASGTDDRIGEQRSAWSDRLA